MTALQTINLGTAPAGSDGDDVRTAFTKDNANIAVLQAQATLTSASLITSAQALTTAHIGKRVNINLGSAGTINLPSASTCAADQVTLLRNLGSTVVTLAVTVGSGDTVSVSKLNPGESALMDTDGLHTWTCLMRGRTNSDNETVNGNCSVLGNEAISGTLGVTGLSTLTGGASFGASGQATISASGAYSGVGAAYSGNVTIGGTLGVTGSATFTVRPAFNGNTPWDSGNLTPSSFALLSSANNFTNGGGQSVSCLRAYGPGVVGTQGSILSWNDTSGSGTGFLTCNIGVGSTGGFAIRTVNSTGTAELGRFSISSAGVGTNGSDARIKSDVTTITNALSIVCRLRGVKFSYTAADELSAGVIAQETQDVCPELVTEMPGAYGLADCLGVNYNGLIGYLIEAIKDLNTRVVELQAKVGPTP